MVPASQSVAWQRATAGLRGLSRSDSSALRLEVAHLVFRPEISAAAAWGQGVTDTLDRAGRRQARWISPEKPGDSLAAYSSVAVARPRQSRWRRTGSTAKRSMLSNSSTPTSWLSSPRQMKP